MKKTKEITVSTSDPESGIFRKGEHKVEFAYTAHTACDKHNFILNTVVTPGNVHDSIVFDRVYDEVNEKFKEIESKDSRDRKGICRCERETQHEIYIHKRSS